MAPFIPNGKPPVTQVIGPENQPVKKNNRMAKIVLSLALASSAAVVAPNLEASAATEYATSHIVQKGDTMYSIAKKHGIFVEQLMAANFTKNTKIIIGQKLMIPHKTHMWFGNMENLDNRQHRVVKGDTLYNISKRTGVSIATIKSINNLKSDVIRIGQILNIYPDNGVRHLEHATYVVKSGDTKYTLQKMFGNAITLPSGTLRILQELPIKGEILQITTEEPFGLADGRVIEVKSGGKYYAINLYQGNERIQHLADRHDLRLTFTVVRVGERYELVSYAVQEMN